MPERILFEDGRAHKETPPPAARRTSPEHRAERPPTAHETAIMAGTKLLLSREAHAVENKQIPSAARPSWLHRRLLSTGLAFGLAIASIGGAHKVEAGIDARPVVVGVERTLEIHEQGRLQRRIEEIKQEWEWRYANEPGRPFARDLAQLEDLKRTEAIELQKADNDFTQASEIAVQNRDGVLMQKLQNIRDKRVQAIQSNYAKLKDPFIKRIEPFRVRYARARDAEIEQAKRDSVQSTQQLRRTTGLVIDAIRNHKNRH